MYEKLVPELREEFFRRMNEDFHTCGIRKDDPIPPGPWNDASLPDKIRWGMLRLLHPAARNAILRNDPSAYDRTIAIRQFLLSAFQKSASLLKFH